MVNRRQIFQAFKKKTLVELAEQCGWRGMEVLTKEQRVDINIAANCAKNDKTNNTRGLSIRCYRMASY